MNELDRQSVQGLANNPRIFIAIELPVHIKDTIPTYIENLKHFVSSPVKWVRPMDTHLTLSFLGNIPRSDVPMITKAIDIVVSGYKPVYLQAGTFGVFPNYSRPRVLWIGLNGDIERLGILQKKICLALEKFYGRLVCHRFMPHLTLCRAKNRSRIYTTGALLRDLNNVTEFNPIGFHASEIAVIESCLTNSGPVYDILATSKI